MPSERNKKGITREQIVELYVKQRKTLKRTAHELGVCGDTLRARMSDFGIERRTKSYLHPNTAAYNEHIQKCASARGRDIIRMLDSGMTYPQIAKREGVSRNRIYQIVRRYRPSNPAPAKEKELCPA